MYDEQMSEGANAALETEERHNQALADDAGLTYAEAEAEVARAKRREFNPGQHMRQLRGRGGNSDYLDVKWRISWFRSEHPDGQIKTWPAQIDLDRPGVKETDLPGFAMFKCRVRTKDGGEAWGWGSETAGDFGDYIEKAETKSVGRALAALGYGTAGAHEMTRPGEDEPVPVDAPIRQADYNQRNRSYNPEHDGGQQGAAQARGSRHAPQRGNPDEPATESQIKYMNKLAGDAGVEEIAAWDALLEKAGVDRKDIPTGGFTKAQISRVIDALLKATKKD